MSCKPSIRLVLASMMSCKPLIRLVIASVLAISTLIYMTQLPDVQTSINSPLITAIDKKSLLITYGPRGRLGNQMFQYASLLGVAALSNRTPFIRAKHGRLLTSMFKITNIKPWKATRNWTKVLEDNFAKYDSHLVECIPKGNVILSGYFQSFKYFQNVLSLVKKEFTFIGKVDIEAREMLHRLHNGSVSVGVHVRIGDLISSPVETMPSMVYFLKAMDWMRNKYGNVTFFVASQDSKWVRANLRKSDVVFLPKASAKVHLAVLSKCDHVIMSLGTFGWWAGLLSGGDVIYFNNPMIPGTWKYKQFSPQDHFLPHWIGLGDEE